MDKKDPNNLILNQAQVNQNPNSSITQNSTTSANLNPSRVVEIKNNSDPNTSANTSLPPQIKNVTPTPASSVKTEFYTDLNKLPTNPNVSLLNQSTPFTPVAKNEPNDAILAPARPSAAEAHYLSASGNKVVGQSQNSQSEGIVPSISNIYSNLQIEAEKSEAIALRGSGIGNYFQEEESVEKENKYADVFVMFFTIASIVVIIVPIFNIFTDFIKLLFFPTLLFIIVSVLISAAFKINNWIATFAFITLLVQLLISVIIIMRVFGIFLGDIPYLSNYLSKFYL